MLIEFTKPWRQFKPGQQTDFFTPGAADILFRKGVAREVVEYPLTAKTIAEPVVIPPIFPPAAPVQAVENSPSRIRRKN